MSTSAECREFSGRRLPEKPSFSQTCSRLSRYLKEKGSFGDLSLGMTCKPDVNVSRQPTMMNLFPCEASGIEEEVKPNNLFPRQSSFSSSSSSGIKEEVDKIKETKSVKPESQSAPLTIFYGGQVLVFDDFPADKAKEVIELANKGSAKSFTPEVSNNQSAYTQSLAVPSLAKPAAQEPIHPNPSSLACELPIARRASLHRFLEKRKDRITSKAPYQIDGSAEASSKPNTAWLGSRLLNHGVYPMEWSRDGGEDKSAEKVTPELSDKNNNSHGSKPDTGDKEEATSTDQIDGSLLSINGKGIFIPKSLIAGSLLSIIIFFCLD